MLVRDLARVGDQQAGFLRNRLPSSIAELGARQAENRDQRTEIRDQRSGIRDQGSGIRDQGSGIRDQGSGIRERYHREIKEIREFGGSR
jgi:hypothetical protein